MTPSDHISHDLSYFSGPRTSGAENQRNDKLVAMDSRFDLQSDFVMFANTRAEGSDWCVISKNLFTPNDHFRSVKSKSLVIKALRQLLFVNTTDF